ncbi:hypothetical protein NE865_00514 [Phthorimaea operculella]|nr:hypothetical protein NE865_00514 [Phthorimaea operculella]
MIGREDREDALLKSALQADERVRVVSEHLTECLMLLEEAPNPEDKELVEGDVSQCLELAQDIAQAAADISRRRDGKEKPFRGKVGQGLQVPLPPVTVPVFAGDYADWPAFEDLYSSVVHTRTDITPAYKMAQLMSRLHGEPHELLTHLAVSDSNYEVAWKILTDRYRNKRLIVDRLLDQWLSIPTITRGTDLREKIFHPVSVAVSALERQGLPVAGYGYILVHTVLRRLPSEMVARFEQLHGGKSSDHLPTYEDLKSFLEAESRRVDVQAGEAPRKETSAPRHPERPGAPARGGNSRQPRRYNTALESGCAYCRETGHGVAACQEFAAQRVQRRRGGTAEALVFSVPGAASGASALQAPTVAKGACPPREGATLPTPSKEEPTSASVTGTGRGTSTDGAHLPKDVGTIPTTAAGAGLGKNGTGTWPGHPSQVRDQTGGCQGSTRQPPGYMQYSAGLSHLVGSQDPRMPPPMPEYPRLQAQPRYGRLPSGYYRTPAMAFMGRPPYQQEWDPYTGLGSEDTPRDAASPRLDSREVIAAYSSASAPRPITVLLPTAKIWVWGYGGRTIQVRALLDTGAQGCIVSSKLVSRLGLNVRPSEDEAVGIGGLNVPDIRGQTNFEFALGSTCTGSAIKSQPWCWMKWLGNSLRRPRRLWCGRKKVLQEAGLVAVDTTGGYVVFGPVWRPQDLPEGDPVLYGSVLSEVLQRFWESEEPPTADRRKPEDDECELFYQYNTARCPSGRFVTRLPFLPNRPALGLAQVCDHPTRDCAHRDTPQVSPIGGM